MPLLTNTTRRISKYQYRIRIPRDLLQRFGRAELKRSLGTSDPTVARRRGRLAGLLVQRLFDEVRINPMLGQDEIRQLVRGFYEARLDDDVAERRALATAAAFHQLPRDDRKRRLQELCQAASVFDFSQMSSAAERLWQQAGVDSPLEEPLKGQLEHFLMRAEIEVIQRQIERDDGMLYGEPRDPLLAAAPPPLAIRPEVAPPAGEVGGRKLNPKFADMLFLDYVEVVIEAKKFEQRAKELGIKVKSMGDKYRSTARMFVEMKGNHPVSQYDDNDILDFRDALVETPKRFRQLGYKSMPEAIKANRKRKKPHPTIQPKTINDSHLAALRGVFRYAHKNRAIARLIIEDTSLEVPVSEAVDDIDLRDPFEIDELNIIFSAPLYAGAKSEKYWHDAGAHYDRGHRFWVPLVMTFMGIRPEEIGQSLLDDIKEFDGYPCWVVTNKLTPEEERGAEKRGARKRSRKKVKTRAARRIIPIHPDLWRLGFMDYIADLRKNGYTRIFPNWRLMGDGTYSALTSDEFNDPTRFLDRLGLKTESKVLYSLRHSFRDVLRASVLTEAYQDYIMGHAAAGMAKQYGSKKLPPRLLDMFIGSVGYRGIDLSKIMDAPGVPAYREDRIPDPIRRRIVRAVERCERLMADAGWSEA